MKKVCQGAENLNDEKSYSMKILTDERFYPTKLFPDEFKKYEQMSDTEDAKQLEDKTTKKCSMTKSEENFTRQKIFAE